MTNNQNQRGTIAEKNTVSMVEILEDIKNNPDFGQAGDIITFTGVVRETSSFSEKKVVQIEIQAVKDSADQQLNQICTELIKEFELIDVRVVHFTGFFDVGEILVHCVVVSKHRREGFQALTKMIDEYKYKAYIFKCEIYVDGTSEWISTVKEDGRE